MAWDQKFQDVNTFVHFSYKSKTGFVTNNYHCMDILKIRDYRKSQKVLASVVQTTITEELCYQKW